MLQFSWVKIVIIVELLSHVQLFVTPWTVGCQAPLSSTISSSLLKFMSIELVMLSNHIVLCQPLLLPLIFLASGSFPVSWLFVPGGQSTKASDSETVFPISIEDWFPLGLTGMISLHPRDSQGSSPAPWFESINFLALSLLYGPILPSVDDYWENHSYDYMDLCW